MKIIDVVQNSPEWLSAKCGIPSASNFSKIITNDGKPSKSALKYAYKLAGEAITGTTEEGYKNSAMVRGNEMEDEARQLYELITGKTVKQVGFCLSDNGKYGASPDGFVGNNGLLEIKCPEKMSIQVERLLKNIFPSEFFQQVQGQLLVTGRKWVDFISYYPGLKPLIVRVKRDEKFLKALEKELIRFCVELEETIKKIK